MGTRQSILMILILVPMIAIADESSAYDDPQTLPNRQTMVHLFEWKWTDIAKECENFLQYYGYGAVQVSPPQEHVVLIKSGDLPWWIRYQPVSYKIISRSGTREQFIDMVNRCNKVGIRIVVDAVLNHMTGIGMKKGIGGVSSSGDSDFDARPGHESFPSVPYNKDDTNDFRCNHNIENSDYTENAIDVRNCRLVGLIDLNQGSPSVRSKMIAYLNDLIGIGIAGFRFDASKHMWPADLKLIIDGVRNLREDIFGPDKRPFIVHEVIDRGGEAVKVAEYIDIGRCTDFTYGALLTSIARGQHKDFSDLQFWGPGYGYGSFASHDILAFIDNHDNQRETNGHVLTHKDKSLYAMVVGFMLAWDYGYPRVMSSYYFTNSDQGPPNFGATKNYKTKSPEFESQYQTCKRVSGWVCEHRWQAIRGMARFRQVATGTNTTIVSAIPGTNRLAFARTGKAFFAANNQQQPWLLTVQTTLPKGCYCEVWTGEPKNGSCTGKIVYVDKQGVAVLGISAGQFEAFHIDTQVDC